MTEKEKMLKGMLYDANYDPQLIAERLECKELCRDYNDLRPKDMEGRKAILKKYWVKLKAKSLSSNLFSVITAITFASERIFTLISIL